MAKKKVVKTKSRGKVKLVFEKEEEGGQEVPIYLHSKKESRLNQYNILMLIASLCYISALVLLTLEEMLYVIAGLIPISFALFIVSFLKGFLKNKRVGRIIIKTGFFGSMIFTVASAFNQVLLPAYLSFAYSFFFLILAKIYVPKSILEI